MSFGLKEKRVCWVAFPDRRKSCLFFFKDVPEKNVEDQ